MSRIAAGLLAHVEAVNRQLTVLATTDALTGVHNRRGFFDTAPQLLADRDPATVLVAGMVDLDHFKELNDAHGHLLGDRALAAVADVLRGAVGVRGLVGRVGGDEFALLAVVSEAGDPTRMATVDDQLRAGGAASQ